MRKLCDLCVIAGTYTQNGQKKNRYENIGTVWEHEGNIIRTIKASFNPAGVPRKEGSDCIRIYEFNTNRENNNPQQSNNNSQGNNRQRSNSTRNQWNPDDNAGYNNPNDDGTPPFYLLPD